VRYGRRERHRRQQQQQQQQRRRHESRGPPHPRNHARPGPAAEEICGVGGRVSVWELGTGGESGGE
jgi:hypothetical protein